MKIDSRKRRADLFEKSDLYVVITEAFCAGRTSLEVLDAVLAAGVTLVQLREKSLHKGALYTLAKLFRERTDNAGALLIINDHVDVALASGADGVHLGQVDLPVDVARVIGPELILGASTHNMQQIEIAVSQGADYVNVGPIYPTGTKPEHKVFLGPEGLVKIAPATPFTVMGGIKSDNIDPVLKAGARHIAVVTAVTQAPDITAAATTLRNKILAVK